MKINRVIVAVTVLLIISSSGAIVSGLQENPPRRETCGESVHKPYTEPVNSVEDLVVKISVTPRERRIPPNKTDTFVICIANPKENNRSIEPIIRFYFGLNKPEKAYVVGRHVMIPTSNHIGELPLNEPKDEGKGRDVVAGEIEPGEVVQYTITVTNISDRGDHEMNVRVEVPIFPDHELKELVYTENAYVNVVCPPSCQIDSIVGYISNLLRKYAEIILLLLTAILVVIGVLQLRKIDFDGSEEAGED